MPKIGLGDFSKVGILPPEGIYRLHFPTNGMVKDNAAGDGQNIIVDVQIIDVPIGGEDFENFEFRQWLSLKISFRDRLKDALESITQKEWNAENTELETDDDDVLVDPAFEDLTVLAHLKQGKDNNNKPQVNVAAWIPDNGETDVVVFGKTEESEDEPF